MDPIRALKLHTAMNDHKLKNHHYILYSFIPYLLIAMTCSLLCSYPFWLPYIEHFLFITLPNVRTSLLSPKCLFLVVNAIVAFLLGESKLGGLHSSVASRDEVYEEYVERSRTRKMLSTGPGSESMREFEDERLTGNEASKEESEEEPGDDEASKEEESEKEPGDDTDGKREAEQEQQRDDDKENDEGHKQEEDGIPAEELKKRVEEFIARFNRERWLEARSLMCVR